MSSLGKAFDKLDHETDGNASALTSRHTTVPEKTSTLPAIAKTAGVESRCLRLVAVNGRAWELPWASFYGADFLKAEMNADAGAVDRIELSFARHEVVLRGKHLIGLMDGFHMMSLPEVRAVEKRFLNAADNIGQPVVAFIEVKKLGR